MRGKTNKRKEYMRCYKEKTKQKIKEQNSTYYQSHKIKVSSVTNPESDAAGSAQRKTSYCERCRTNITILITILK